MIIDCFILFPFKGVPKSKRGEIWRFLAKQHKFQSPPGDRPWNEKSYEEIKEGLSTHQHSIFIDLGKCSIFLLRYTQNKSKSVMLLLQFNSIQFFIHTMQDIYKSVHSRKIK